MTDWRGWKITDKQAEEIRNGDINARNGFYMDNLSRIRSMAYNYVKRNYNCSGLTDDLIQGVYVDLSVFKQANGLPVVDGVSLSSFIYNSFRFAPYGGLCYLFENNPKILCGGEAYKTYCPTFLSLDKPFNKGDNRHQDDDNARTLGEVVPAPDMFEQIDYTDVLKDLVKDLLSPRENEYFCYFVEGYCETDITRLMGYNGQSNNADRVRAKLRLNYNIILDRLSLAGVSIDYYKNKAPYNPKKERKYKLSVEQRAKAAERQRRRRAAQKLSSFESAFSNAE